ncbi:MAG TPA: YIP1 family protein [Spirochaetota bacterium]|nr:YIP1 family protein [Spirochaetota bacterium]
MNMETLRELAWTDFFFYAIVSPRELYRRIKQRDSGMLQLSFAVPALSAFFDIIILSLNGAESGFFYHKISYGWLLFLFILLLKIIVYTALIDSSAQFFGYSGNIKDTVSLVNFAMFPGLMFLPVYYIIYITGIAPGFFYVFLSFVFFCWFILILAQGISEMYSIQSGRALAIILAPAVVTGVLMFFTFIVFIFSLVGFIAN